MITGGTVVVHNIHRQNNIQTPIDCNQSALHSHAYSFLTDRQRGETERSVSYACIANSATRKKEREGGIVCGISSRFQRKKSQRKRVA